MNAGGILQIVFPLFVITVAILLIRFAISNWERPNDKSGGGDDPLDPNPEKPVNASPKEMGEEDIERIILERRGISSARERAAREIVR